MTIENENLDFLKDIANEEKPSTQEAAAPAPQPQPAPAPKPAPAPAPAAQEASMDFGGTDDLDFSLFTGGDAGYQVLSNEKLQSLAKKLPSWSLEPPAKYVK